MSAAADQPRLETIVKNLNDWVNKATAINKIKAVYIPEFRLAAAATTHLNKEDVYLSVPPELIMDVSACTNTCLIFICHSQLICLKLSNDAEIEEFNSIQVR